MFGKLLLAAALIAATVVVQAIFMAMGLRVFRRMDPGYLSRHATVATVIWVTYLLIPIILDIGLWAFFYYATGALANLEDATYFSTVTFTTVGYGDIVLGKDWRHVSVFEAVNGWIIFGWATALIMAIIQKLYFQADADPDQF
ncbi:potassium channel family protein [Rhizobium sp. Pop5]|uniref:potassium channel family protein n=1 Tax=Rhizobium sp. Pop5 TaxID=1223565 RepID=UPI00028398E3|nr:potassium channel family protein [Rhizobium sp. Pop5]EJZ17329.1 Potassium voltage-gated channel subfamily B member 2 Voltage-gated potassium channel subunit Kv2.2 [Rhizobium sp. Pop5]UVD59071.1 potassium channel family protein [Rhizobium sp. Pop5]